MGWREKDDLDLTSEDVDAMIAEGEPAVLRGPLLAVGARLIKTAATLAGPLTIRPVVLQPTTQIVGAKATHGTS